MLKYHPGLKQFSRRLRTDMTDAEQCLWARLRRKQLLGVQFYRQKPIGSYIADFYAPTARLIVEVDGGQHFESKGVERDVKRDGYFVSQGLHVLRFDNRQMLVQCDAVVEVIYHFIREQLANENGTH